MGSKLKIILFYSITFQGGQTGNDSRKHIAILKCFFNNVSQGGQTGKHSRKHSNSQMSSQQCFPGWTSWETVSGNIRGKIAIVKCFLNIVSQGGQITGKHSRKHSNSHMFLQQCFPGWTNLETFEETANLKCFLNIVSQGGQTGKHSRKHSRKQQISNVS